MDSGRNEEYPHWHLNPFLLTNTEIEDPYLVLEEFFSCYSLINLRGELWYVLTTIFEHSENVERPGRILFLFRQLERLVESAFIIHQKTFNKNFMSKNKIVLERIGTQLSELPGVDMVICYGIRSRQEGIWSCFNHYYREPFEIEEGVDLLILGYGNISEAKIAASIDLPGIKPVLNIQKADTVYNLVKYGNYFFSTIVQSGNILFSRKQADPFTGSIDPASLSHQQATEIMSHANLFFKGAVFYLQEEDYNFNAFMCHQAVEQALFGLIQKATGFRAQTHNFYKMVDLTLTFTPDIWNLVTRMNDKQIISHLIRAYSEVRFNDRFSTGKNLAENITAFTKTMLQVIEGLLRTIIEK